MFAALGSSEHKFLPERVAARQWVAQNDQTRVIPELCFLRETFAIDSQGYLGKSGGGGILYKRVCFLRLMLFPIIAGR